MKDLIAQVLRQHKDKCPSTQAGEVVVALGFDVSAHPPLLVTLNAATSYYYAVALSDDNPGDWPTFVAARLEAELLHLEPPPMKMATLRTEWYSGNSEVLYQAWRLPMARRWRSRFFFQESCTSCSLATAANLAESIGCHSTEDELARIAGRPGPEGRPLSMVAHLVQHQTGRRPEVLNDLSLVEWRRLLRLSNDPHYRLAVSFTRAPLFGFGGGHHSPIGGYLEEEDLVLVLDTNQDIGPFLVSADRLLSAVNTTDPVSGEKRGALLLEV